MEEARKGLFSMKPVAIFRHVRIEGPGHLANFLDRHDIPLRLIRIDIGDPLPQDISAYSGMVLMGGPMSVNDELPWIPPLLKLICDAKQYDIPLLGHCLGGQMISKALGAKVSRNPVKEIGWFDVDVFQGDVATDWLGAETTFEVFHWHGETFTLPHGATHLLSSRHCEHQTYVLGKHLVLQCHVEMTMDMVKDWCVAGASEIASEIGNEAVQSQDEILENLSERVARLHIIADRLYQRWIQGLRA